MKMIRCASGPFAERPVFTPEDIDSICTKELDDAGLYPDDPEPIRIERFVEKRFGITVTYESTPAGVLGYTRFGPKGVEAVIVSSLLEEVDTDSSRRRANSTLAHEAGHGILHGYLFGLIGKDDVFSVLNEETGSSKPQILCRDGASSWWEVQANMTIGSLLLPHALVMQSIKPLLVMGGSDGGGVLDSAARASAIRQLSSTFDVNPVVAKFRLEQMFPC